MNHEEIKRYKIKLGKHWEEECGTLEKRIYRSPNEIRPVFKRNMTGSQYKEAARQTKSILKNRYYKWSEKEDEESIFKGQFAFIRSCTDKEIMGNLLNNNHEGWRWQPSKIEEIFK